MGGDEGFCGGEGGGFGGAVGGEGVGRHPPEGAREWFHRKLRSRLRRGWRLRRRRLLCGLWWGRRGRLLGCWLFGG